MCPKVGRFLWVSFVLGVFFSLSSLLWRVQKNAKSTKWERWKVLERPFADVKVILFTLSLKTDFDILYVFNILLSLAIHKIFRSTTDRSKNINNSNLYKFCVSLWCVAFFFHCCNMKVRKKRAKKKSRAHKKCVCNCARSNFKRRKKVKKVGKKWQKHKLVGAQKLFWKKKTRKTMLL